MHLVAAGMDGGERGGGLSSGGEGMIVFVLTILMAGQPLKMAMVLHTSVGCQNLGQKMVDAGVKYYPERNKTMTFRCDAVLMAAKD
jgi:hypothetical protein